MLTKLTQTSPLFEVFFFKNIPFSIDISWFSNLSETDETEKPW